MRKLKKQMHAVSPVVATLMLVLVAVGSAGILYAWQVGWMDQQSSELANTGARRTLTIDGSSTVYPFSVVAKEMYEAQNPDVKISVTYTGSGAGREGVRTGAIDIGSASSATDPESVEVDLNNDGNKDVVGTVLVTHVAQDPVAVCCDVTANLDLTKEQLTAIYLLNLDIWTNADLTGDYAPGTLGITPTGSTGDEFLWSDLNSLTPDDISGNSNPVGIGVRTCESGTQETFTTLGTFIEELTGNEQLIGFANDAGGCGNPELMASMEATGNILGFNTVDGVAGSSTMKLVKIDGSVPGDSDYAANRFLDYITIDLNEDGKLDPGVAQDFIEFCRIPEVNIAIATAAGYTPLYS